MDDITDMTVAECQQSEFVRPLRLHYKQMGKPKTWDIVRVHNCVSIVIYNVSRNVLVFVKQFRPAVYYNGLPTEEQVSLGDDRSVDTSKNQPSRGLTIELCAGIVDKDVSLEEIARIEILEECGYQVPVQSLQRIITFRSGMGISGDRQTLFYVEVTDAMRVTDGGGNPDEGELLEVVEMSVAEVRRYVQQSEVLSPGGFLFGVTWFLANKAGLLNQ